MLTQYIARSVAELTRDLACEKLGESKEEWDRLLSAPLRMGESGEFSFGDDHGALWFYPTPGDIWRVLWSDAGSTGDTIYLLPDHRLLTAEDGEEWERLMG